MGEGLTKFGRPKYRKGMTENVTINWKMNRVKLGRVVRWSKSFSEGENIGKGLEERGWGVSVCSRS